MHISRYSIILGFCAISLGCTKGNPNFAVLDSTAIPQPVFTSTNATTAAVQITDAGLPIATSIKCNTKFDSFLAAANTGYSNQSISATCGTSGTIAVSLDSLMAMHFTISDNSNYDIMISAVTDGGVSQPSVLHVQYGKPKHVVLTSGSTQSPQSTAMTSLSGQQFARIATTSSAQYGAVVRISNTANAGIATVSPTSDQMNLKTSAHYQMRAGLAIAPGEFQANAP